MEYIKPTYEVEAVETNDIIMISLGDGVVLTEKNETSAEVSASLYSILGLR